MQTAHQEYRAIGECDGNVDAGAIETLDDTTLRLVVGGAGPHGEWLSLAGPNGEW